MAKVSEIKNMTVDELRPYIQRAMGLEQWPVNDWIVVGAIIEECGLVITRAHAPTYSFDIQIQGKNPRDRGMGHGVGPDFVRAIFQGYLEYRSIALSYKTGVWE
jgi:hypothetical protein